MRTSLRALLAVGLIASTQAQAQELDDRWYIAPSLIYNFADSDRDSDDGLGLGIALGKAISPHWNLEYGLRWHKLDHDFDSDDLHIVDLGVDALYIFDRNSRIQPFLVGGVGVMRAELGGDNDVGPTANAGLGLMTSLNDRLSLRADVRYRWDDVFDNESYGDVLVGVGLSYAFGAKPAATDTAPAPVAAPPAPADSDGDGVPDDRDRCPNTPAGAAVDADGCELDSDNDGIVDRLDQCPDTPAGTKVDRNGCELPQIIELPNVNFANASAELTPDSRATLEAAAEDLKANPGIKVEVAGHTDNRGALAYNQRLSEQRAQSVRDFLISLGVPAANITAKGYGPSEPIADNDTAEGRQRNRRVELRVLD